MKWKSLYVGKLTGGLTNENFLRPVLNSDLGHPLMLLNGDLLLLLIDP